MSNLLFTVNIFMVSIKSESRSVTSESFTPHSPWNFPGQNTGMGSFSLLQGIFPMQGSNPVLLHYKWILYQLSHKGSQRILEWVAYLFSSGSSWPRNQTGVSCMTDKFFTTWATREKRSPLNFKIKYSKVQHTKMFNITKWKHAFREQAIGPKE